MKVLIVDDSTIVRQQVAGALGPLGHQVIEAVDGLDGLAQVRATPDLRLILCDVIMPRMNGIEMLEALHREPGGNVPFLMLTTVGQSDAVRRAAQAGAVGWMVKPFKEAHLLAAIDKLAAKGLIP